MEIKRLIFEGDLEEVAKTVGEAESQQLAFFLKRTSYGLKGVLYSPEQINNFFQQLNPAAQQVFDADIRKFRGRGVYGTFTANFQPRIDGYEIDTMAALNSYGPLMYDILSSYGGWIIRDTVGISDDAQKIWEYIFTRRDDWEFEWIPKEFRIDDRKSNPLNYKYKIKKPIPMGNLIAAHEEFVSSLEKDPQLVEDVLARFGTIFFSEMYF